MTVSAFGVEHDELSKGAREVYDRARPYVAGSSGDKRNTKYLLAQQAGAVLGGPSTRGKLIGSAVGMAYYAHHRHTPGGMKDIHNSQVAARRSKAYRDAQRKRIREAGPDEIVKAESLSKKRLTAAERNKLPDSDFADPVHRRFPMEDEAHAKNALARAKQGFAGKKLLRRIERREDEMVHKSAFGVVDDRESVQKAEEQPSVRAVIAAHEGLGAAGLAFRDKAGKKQFKRDAKMARRTIRQGPYTQENRRTYRRAAGYGAGAGAALGALAGARHGAAAALGGAAGGAAGGALYGTALGEGPVAMRAARHTVDRGIRQGYITTGGETVEKGRRKREHEELVRSLSRGERLGSALASPFYTAHKAPKGKKMRAVKTQTREAFRRPLGGGHATAAGYARAKREWERDD
jgi:hypothetical protein